MTTNAQQFVNYWIGQQAMPPGPQLGQMPTYVDVAPLAYVYSTYDATTKAYGLDFGFLTQQAPESQIKTWAKAVHDQGTKVLFSLGSSAQTIWKTSRILRSSPLPSSTSSRIGGSMASISTTSRSAPARPSCHRPTASCAAAAGSLVTAPIWAPWTRDPAAAEYLHAFAQSLDWVTTMDYTPYPGYQYTLDQVESYAKAIGSDEDPSWDKVVIGVSCMGPFLRRRPNSSPAVIIRRSMTSRSFVPGSRPTAPRRASCSTHSPMT